MRINWRHHATNHPRVVDAVLVVLLFLAASGPAVLNSDLSATDDLSWQSAVPLAAIGALAMLGRRSHPHVVVVVTTLCATAAAAFGYLVTPILLAPVMVALYELALRIPSRAAGRFWLGSAAAIATASLVDDTYDYPWPLQILNPVLFLLLPVALAEAVRARRDHVADEARRRVAAERVHIARELHDAVAHHLALANAQAGTAAYLADARPDQVRQILADLAGTTSAALRELKATVGLLRHPDEPSSPLEPTPGLDRLPDLVAAFASADLAVEVTVDGTERPLSAGVDLSAFRIVQEALTNVTKHAGTDTAHVQLAYRGDRLTITVSNALGRPAPQDNGTGYGILGMRERAHSAGGWCQAGPDDTGGFTVTTELPIPAPTETKTKTSP